MNKKRLFTLLLTGIICINLLFSQNNVNIIGHIKDQNDEVVDYASIFLLAKNDSTYLDGVLTDSLGIFKFNNCEKNKKYLLQVKHIGYKTYVNEITANDSILNISIENSNISLNNIIIVGKQPTQKIKDGKLINRIENTVLSNTGTANDVLDKLSGIIKKDNSYTVFGKKQTVIYINDKEVKNEEQLERLRSEDIITVEVINNPSAYYGGNVEGVIKIITKTTITENFGIIARIRGRQGRRLGGNQLLNITHQHKKINFFVSLYNNNYRIKTDNENTHSYINNNTFLETDIKAIKWKQNYNYLSSEMGLNLKINENHTVNLGYETSYNKDEYGGTSNNKRYTDNLLVEKWKVLSHSRNKTFNHQLNINYSGKFSDKINLEFDFDYLNKNSKRKQSALDLTEFVSNKENEYNNRINSNLLASKITINWKQNSNNSLKLGWQNSYIESTNKYFTTDSVISGNYNKTKDMRNSLFASQYSKIGNLDVSIGVRYEHYYSNKKFNKNENNSKKYNDIFPILSLSLPVKNTYMSINFSQRTQKPTFYQLRSGVEYLNNYLYEKGNPLLQPENIYNFSYNFTFDFIVFSIDYQYVKNYISNSIDYLDKENSILVGSFQNINKYRRLSFFLSLNKKIGIWNPIWNFSLQQPFFTNTYLLKKMRYNNPFLISNLSNIFQLPKETKILIDGSIKTTGNDEDTYLNAQAYLNLGIKKSFLNKTLEVDLRVYDIFASQTNKPRLYNNITKMKLYSFQDSRALMINLTYKFYNYNKKYQRVNAAKEDLNRL